MSKILHPNVFLFLEPVGNASTEPTLDKLYYDMEDALGEAMSRAESHRFEPNDDPFTYGRVGADGTFAPGEKATVSVSCRCGIRVDTYDYMIVGGAYTHSAAAHFLKCHRADIRPAEIDRLKKHFADNDPDREWDPPHDNFDDPTGFSTPPNPKRKSDAGAAVEDPADKLKMVAGPWVALHPETGKPLRISGIFKCTKCERKTHLFFRKFEKCGEELDINRLVWTCCYTFAKKGPLTCQSCTTNKKRKN